jgi:DHA2 family multidrug resistance protein
MGGDIGIALVTTLLARRSQVHQANLAAYGTPFHSAFQARIQAMAAGLEHGGIAAADATRKATALVYRTLIQQAMTLAYVDVLWLFGVGTTCMLPLLFLLKRAKPGAAAGGH